MTELSPAAQAVRSAYHEICEDYIETWLSFNHNRGLAAALRVAVEQILPENANPVGDLHDDARHDQWMRIRYKFLALAAELERENDC